MYHILVITVGFLAVLFSPAILAEESVTDFHHDPLRVNAKLTMQEVLQKTLARQPQRLVLQAQEFTVSAQKTMAQSFLPAAPAVSLSHQNDVSGRNERDWQAAVELPVWLPKQRDARTKVAELGAQNLTADRESLQLQAAGLLRDALWDVAMNQNEVALFQKKMEQARKLEADVSKKFHAGELAKTDLMLAQQEVLSAQRGLIGAEAELMHARFRYTLLTGLNEIPENFTEKQSHFVDFKQSPLWMASEAKVTLAQGERDLTQIEKRENATVTLNARSARGAFDERYNQSVGIEMHIPLESAVRNAPLQAVAEQTLGEAMHQREALYYALEAALHEAEHNLEVSQRELELATKYLQIANESARLAEKAYALGEQTLTGLILIQAKTFEVERSYVSRQLQVQWNVARYNQAVGVLP